MASVLLSRSTFTCSLASIAWCRPSEYRRPIISRPVNYIAYEVSSLDGKKHNVTLRLLAGREWALNTPADQESVSETYEKDGLLFLKTGNKAPRRIGMELGMTPEHTAFRYLGKGPHDTYFGREESGIIAVHEQHILDQENYIRPQEHGNKTGIRRMSLTDSEGHGLLAEMTDQPLSSSVWPYTLEELHKAEHIHELPDHHISLWNIDLLQNGLGDCFNPCIEEYRIKTNTVYRCRFLLSVTDKGIE